MNDIARVVDLMGKGEPFCLATIVASDDPDVPIGRKMIVLGDGTTEGGVGSARLDAALRDRAREALAEKKKRTVQVETGIRAFLDILSTEVNLLICGAGHIALPLARFAREVGFRVTVLDDRSDFAHASRFPGCEVIAEDFATALRRIPVTPVTSVVVITRGHEHDVECLAAVLPRETAYVGLIGSRRRVRFVLDLLRGKGIARERLDEVFTPIGLPIGSETPEEIALSIVAELVCARRKGFSRARALRAAAEGGK
jgi:xanthine dehydrogenase accessory factor